MAPLLSIGRQQRYGPYCLQAAAALWPLLSPGGSSAMAPIVCRQAAVVREYGQGSARLEAVQRRFGTEA